MKFPAIDIISAIPRCFVLIFGRAGGAILLILSLLGAKAGAALADVRGLWNLQGTTQSYWPCLADLQPIAFQPAYTSFLFGTSPFQFFVSTLNVPTLTSTQGIRMVNWSGPNGGVGATKTNRWTLAYDVRLANPNATSRWASLMQSNANNTDDAEIFINDNGSIYLGGVAAPAGTVTAGFHRVVVTCENNGLGGALSVRAYLDGVAVGSVINSPYEGRFGLDSDVRLFADDSGETGGIAVLSAAFWNSALTPAEVALLGTGTSTNGIAWTGRPAPTACPGLSGRLMFGNIPTIMTPGEFKIVLSVAGPAVQIDADMANISGFSDHVFGGVFPFQYEADGDLAMVHPLVSVELNIGTKSQYVGGILIQRDPITLSSSGAKTSQFTWKFPRGLSAGISYASTPPLTLKTKRKAVYENLSLGANLLPLTSYLDYLPSAENADDVVDRIAVNHEEHPVWIYCQALRWNVATGRITCEMNTGPASASFVREPDRAALAGLPAVFGPGVRQSNDDYYHWAQGITGTPEFDGLGNTNSARVRSLNLLLNKVASPTEYRAHFPQNFLVKWLAAAQLQITNGQIQSTSILGDGRNTEISVPRDCADVDCPPSSQAGSKAYQFYPTTDWFVTNDGGLGGACTILTASDNAGSALRTVEWGAISPTTFAHQITTPWTVGRFRVPGNFLRGEDSVGILDKNKPAALLLCGLGSAANASLREMPGTTGYNQGLADYAGMNLLAGNDNFYSANSRLGGQATGSYALRGVSKYYLRPSGVTGRHEAVSNPNPPPNTPYPLNLTIYGFPVGLTSMRVSFLDSENWDSSIQGRLTVPAPANLGDIKFKNLLFGCRGELKNATLDNNNELTLGYWNSKLTPRALNFGVPAGDCPPVAQGCLVLGVEAKWSALSDQAFIGNLGFKSNGHTVVPADNFVLGDNVITSRLQPPNGLFIKGPGTKTYPMMARMQGAWLNEYAGSPPTPNGFVCIPGEVDVPYFKSLPVVLHASASVAATPGSAVNVMAGDLPGYDTVTDAAVDSGNLGYPSAVGLATFRSAEAWKPHAKRTWLDVVDFDFPVSWQDSSKLFTGIEVSKDLMIFNIQQRVKTMSPDVADLRFGVTVPSLDSLSKAGLKDIGVTKLVEKIPAGALRNSVNSLLTGKLDVASLGAVAIDELLGDMPQAAFGPTLDAQVLAAINAGSPLYTQLRNAYVTGGGLANFKSQGPLLVANTQAPMGVKIAELVASGGSWLATIRSRVGQARTAVDKLLLIVNDTSSMAAVAIAIAGQDSNAATLVADVQETIAGLQQNLLEIGKRLDAISAKLQDGEDMAIMLALLMQGTNLNAAIASLTEDWITGLVNANLPINATDPLGAYFATDHRAEFEAAVTARVREVVFGSSVFQDFRAKVSYLLADVAFSFANAFNGVLSVGNDIAGAMKGAVIPGGDVAALGGGFSGALKGAKLQGAARIEGDSLKEVRIDGECLLAVPDDMRFDAWFILRDVDSSMPGGLCLAAGGMKTEATLGAAVKMTYAGQLLDVDAQMKLGIGASGLPVSLAGDIGLNSPFTIGSVTAKSIRLGAAFGANQAYLWGKAAGELNTPQFAITAEVGFFGGKTCELSPIQKINPDVLSVVNQLGLGSPTEASPIYGIYARGYGTFSVLSLIGIPPTCLLDLRVGGGGGTFLFSQGSNFIAGQELAFGISGEALCLVNVGGRLDGVLAASVNPVPASPAQIDFKNVRAAGRLTARFSAEIGVCPFCYDWEKTLRVDVSVDNNASPKVKWNANF